MDCIRKKAEACNNLNGFAVFSALGGGTGSGFGSLLYEKLADEYPEQAKLAISMFPSTSAGKALNNANYPRCEQSIDSYNLGFALQSITESTHAQLILEPSALQKPYDRYLSDSFNDGSYKEVNEHISLILNGITAPFRHKDVLSDCRNLRSFCQ